MRIEEYKLKVSVDSDHIASTKFHIPAHPDDILLSVTPSIHDSTATEVTLIAAIQHMYASQLSGNVDVEGTKYIWLVKPNTELDRNALVGWHLSIQLH